MRDFLLIAGLALALACGREEAEPATAASAAVIVAADSQGRLDPAPYRAKIEAAELLFYSTEALSDEGWKALSTALLELHNEIVFRDESASARETSARLFFLSARADATKSRSHSDGELAELRGLWSQLCGEKFVPASWLRASSLVPELRARGAPE